jgi:hypothetical protein
MHNLKAGIRVVHSPEAVRFLVRLFCNEFFTPTGAGAGCGSGREGVFPPVSVSLSPLPPPARGALSNQASQEAGQ